MIVYISATDIVCITPNHLIFRSTRLEFGFTLWLSTVHYSIIILTFTTCVFQSRFRSVPAVVRLHKRDGVAITFGMSEAGQCRRWLGNENVSARQELSSHGLLYHLLVVAMIMLHQLVMGSHFYDSSVVDASNQVCVSDRSESVSYDDCGDTRTFLQEAVNTPLYHLFRIGI